MELVLTAELLVDELASELDVVEAVAASDFALLELALELGMARALEFFLPSPLPPQPLSSTVRLTDINRKYNFIFSIPFICEWLSLCSMTSLSDKFFGTLFQRNP